MRKIFLVFLISANLCFAADTIDLEHPWIDKNNKASIQRGAKFFAANCMACHTMIYMRYNKLAHDSGVIYEKMPVNIKTWPLGIKPPDLSLEADYRGVDWIFTYLHSFYQDKSRPNGVNNLVLVNTAMPGILVPFQGQQVLVKAPKVSEEKYIHEEEWYDKLELVSHGSLTPEQFDATLTDVVNFLAYAAQPYHHEQTLIGIGVIIFLFFLWIMLYLLKKNYWRDIK